MQSKFFLNQMLYILGTNNTAIRPVFPTHQTVPNNHWIYLFCPDKVCNYKHFFDGFPQWITGKIDDPEKIPIYSCGNREGNIS